MAVISKEDWVKLKNKVSKLNYPSALYFLESMFSVFYFLSIQADCSSHTELHQTGLNFI